MCKSHRLPGGRVRGHHTGFGWLVVIGANADREEMLRGPVPPDEDTVRRVFGLATDVPVLIGMP